MRLKIMNANIYIGLHEAKRRQFILNKCSPLILSKAELIKTMVCQFMQQSVVDVESQSRKREYATTRQICMYFLNEKTPLTLKQIGAMLGDRDHSTVLYGKQTINDLMDTDSEFREQIISLDKLLQVEMKNLKILT